MLINNHVGVELGKEFMEILLLECHVRIGLAVKSKFDMIVEGNLWWKRLDFIDFEPWIFSDIGNEGKRNSIEWPTDLKILRFVRSTKKELEINYSKWIWEQIFR